MLNIVIFGAPGSGKEHKANVLLRNTELITFQQEMYCVQKLKTAQNWVKQLKATLIRDS